MKKAFRLFSALVVAAGLSSCVADLSRRVDELEDQVTTILSSLDQLKKYVESQIYVSGYEETADGFILKLSNGETMAVKHGQKGADGTSVVDGIDGIYSVSIEEDYVVFTLEDGSKLALPRSPKTINLVFTDVEVNVYDGKAEFTVTDALDPYILVIADSDIRFEVSEIKDNKGTISFTKGSSVSAKLYATVIDNASAGCNTNTKVLKVNFETAGFNTELSDIKLPSDGGSFKIAFSTNVPYELDYPEWIQGATKAMKEYEKSFTVSANEDNARAGVIRIIDSVSKEEVGSFNIEQRGKLNYLYILNEGTWGANNSSISLYDFASGKVTNNWYSSVNGSALGDTGNDILVTEDYIIVAVNTSNIIQFCDLDGKAVAQTESVANCRKLVADPEGNYVYVTSYANDGYVAKIDLTTFEVVGQAKTGYEPEGIAWYDGKLYIANSGGYSYMGTHDYEDSISIIDADTMEEISTVSTGCINLYGGFVQNEKYPQYILVNSAGDYYETPAMSLIFDCESAEVVDYFEFPATYASQYDGVFYSLGSEFSYATYAYEYYCNRIDMSSGAPEVIEGLCDGEDTITAKIKTMAAPYGLFVAPDGEVVVSDAANYSSRGSVTFFSKEGVQLRTMTAGVCPGHFAVR